MTMKKKLWPAYAAGILLTEAVGALSGWLTREGVQLYAQTIVKPPLSPPGIVFPVVWTILYALMGIGAARVYLAPPSAERCLALRAYLLQLCFNFFWSIWFFGAQWYGFAFLWLLALWCLILWMREAFDRVDRTASRLQIPYLLWVTFAGYLNLGVWWLNRCMH